VARKMVTVWGMSEKMGPRSFGQKEELIFLGREISEQRDYSEKTALQIDAEVNKFIDDAYVAATRLLTDNRERLVHLAQILIVKENLEGEELAAAFSEPVDTPIPTVNLSSATPAAAPSSTSVSAPVPSTPPKTTPAPRPLPST
jgi:cell division protease FtsH